MKKTEPKQTRRALLRSTTLALASGIAGCTSLTGNQQTKTPKSSKSPEPTTPAQSSSTKTTPPEKTAETTKTQTATPTTSEKSTAPSGSYPYIRSTTGTTKYGVELDGNPVLGSDDAPIDMLYWSDYLCPYCRTFAREISPKVVKNAVADGSLRIIVLELPNIGKNSWPAAILAKCVWKQVKDDNPSAYWDWHHAVFEQQGKPDSGWASRQNLFDITRSVGIDTEPVTTCTNTQKDTVEKDIEAEITAADKAKIPGTPAFLLHNRQTKQSKTLLGAQPYTKFESTIETLME